jgi:DNA-binding XRE family transcriptional regulator
MAPPRNPNYVFRDTDTKRSKPYILKACAGCGEEKLIRTTGKYCSKSCSALQQHADGRSRQLSGTEHYKWKGSEAGYQALHNRVIKARGKADQCANRETEGCVSEKYEWAHIHGTDPADTRSYMSLCKTCHITYDDQRGSGHTNSKLSAAQIREIRELYATGDVSQQALADLFGVYQTTISKIVRERTYKE